MARKRYLGRANEELDAMFAELDSIDRSTKAGRRKYRALSNKIRRKREDRILSGIRGLFGSRKYPVPAAASGAASTMGFPGVPESPIGIGTMAEAPPAPDIPIEEITVDAKRRRRSEPNIELAELPVTQSRAPSLRAQVPFGIYTGELAEQFGNEPEIQQSMMSKLGRNQLRSLERRKRKVAQYPDAYPPDYATPEGMFKYAEGRTIEGNRMIGEGGMLFDPTDPTDYGLMALGMAPIPGARIGAAAGKLRKLGKIHPRWTGADTPLTWAEIGKRAKVKRGVTALQPTKEALEEAAENRLWRGMQYKLGLPVTAVGVIGSNLAEYDEDGRLIIGADEQETIEEIREETEREKRFWDAYEANPDAFSKDMIEYMKQNEPERKAGGGQLMGQAQRLAQAGRGEDTMLMHVTPDEVAGIASLAPGMMTINPQTGLPEAGFFRDILGFAAPFLVSMIPGVGPVLGGALGGGLRTAIEGGDFKDLLMNAGLGALGGKVFGNLGKAGAQNIADQAATGALASPEAFGQAMQGVGSEGFADIAAKAGIDANAFQQAVSGGMDPSAYLSQVANPSQIASFQKGLSDVAMSNMPAPTFAGNIKNIGAAGLGGVQDALISKAGLPLIAGEGLKAQNTAYNRYKEMLSNMEEEKKRKEEELYRMYPENIPYRGGGSLYKNRYINGNWS